MVVEDVVQGHSGKRQNKDSDRGYPDCNPEKANWAGS